MPNRAWAEVPFYIRWVAPCEIIRGPMNSAPAGAQAGMVIARQILNEADAQISMPDITDSNMEDAFFKGFKDALVFADGLGTDTSRIDSRAWRHISRKVSDAWRVLEPIAREGDPYMTGWDLYLACNRKGWCSETYSASEARRLRKAATTMGRLKLKVSEDTGLYILA